MLQSKEGYGGGRRQKVAGRPSAYAIKVEIADISSASAFDDQKTMYGGKAIAPDDPIFVFASENSGGEGLVSRGIVTGVRATPRKPDVARQTPRVSVTLRITGQAKNACGRNELRAFDRWDDGRPETELNFKLYRQATDKIVGLSEDAAAFLTRFF